MDFQRLPRFPHPCCTRYCGSCQFKATTANAYLRLFLSRRPKRRYLFLSLLRLFESLPVNSRLHLQVVVCEECHAEDIFFRRTNVTEYSNKRGTISYSNECDVTSLECQSRYRNRRKTYHKFVVSEFYRCFVFFQRSAHKPL